MRQLTIEDIKWRVECLPEYIPISGNAISTGNTEKDIKYERELYQKSKTNPWAWCTIKVTGEFKGLSCDDYLGCCSYNSRKDFLECPYYADIQNGILVDIMSQVQDIVNFMEQDETIIKTTS